MKLSSYKFGYIVFIGLVILTLIINSYMVQSQLDSQFEDAKLINTTGRQRMLSQRIAKRIMYTYDILQHSETVYQDDLDTLSSLLNQIEKVHFGLINNEASLEWTQPLSEEVMELLNDNTPYLNNILLFGRRILDDPTLETFDNSIQSLEDNDLEFLLRMETIVATLQDEHEVKLAKVKRVELTLLAVSIILLILCFRLVIVPLIKVLTEKNKTLRTLSDQTIRQNKQLLGFAHITSHNLRAPATNLKSLIKFYKEEQDPEEKNVLLGHMETVSNHLNNTLEDLMTTLKIKEEAKKNLEFVDFEATIKKIKEILIAQMKSTQVVIKTEFIQCRGLKTNRIYLESIFLNLISNAIKYSSLDRPPILDILSEKKGGRIFLTFTDNGLGIDMKKFGKMIFGLNNTFHKHKDSKGVGLYLTKTQIEAMGGEIFVESEVDIGSTFTLVFH